MSANKIQAAVNKSPSIAISDQTQSIVVFVSLLLMAVGGLTAYYSQGTLGEVLSIIGILAFAFKQFIGSSSPPNPATGLTNVQQALITFVGLIMYAVGTAVVPIGAPLWVGFVLHLSGAISLAIKEYLGTWSSPTNLPNQAQGIIGFGAMFILGTGQILQAQNANNWAFVFGLQLAAAVALTLQEWISPPTPTVQVGGQSVTIPESAPPS
jgi:hypothetical protein